MRRAVIIFSSLLFFFSILHKLHEAKVVAGEHLPSSDITSYYPQEITEPIFIIHFFSTWCKYCFRAIPNLEYLINQYNVPIYGILYRDTLYNLDKYADTPLGRLFKHVTEDPSLINKLKVTSVPYTCVVKKSNSTPQKISCFSTNDTQALKAALPLLVH